MTVTDGTIPLKMVTGRRGIGGLRFPAFVKGFDMIKLKDPTGFRRLMSLVLTLAVMLAAAAPVLHPRAARATEGTWQDLVLLYTTDIKGKIEPCG